MAGYDTIVVGSGFGAACAALDLVGRGQRLLMLETRTSVARGVVGLVECIYRDAGTRRAARGP